MHMQWDWLISPFFGAVIGYGTNYLAIKMLFRPHNPIYIGKMKLPFTPGLIPKEKTTLAKQMGEITEEYLLTEDMLVETLTNDKAQKMFLGLIDRMFRLLEDNDQSINNFLEDISNQDIMQITETIRAQMAIEIATMLKSKEVVESIVPYMVNLIKESSSDSISESIKEFSRDILKNEQTQEHINDILDDLDRTITDLLQEHASDIGRGIIAAIGTGETTDKIKETLQHWIDHNFNPMVSMFINIDKIYSGIIDFASEALDDPERSQKFGQLLCKIVNEFDYKNEGLKILKEQLGARDTGPIINIIKEELINKEDDIKGWLYKRWTEYISREEFLEQVNQMISRLIKTIGDTPLASLSAMVPNKQISQRLFAYYSKLIARNSKSVVEVMDISNLVENRINEYSSEEAERVILSVVKNQLRGITWIGALLGFLIGMISNFIR